MKCLPSIPQVLRGRGHNKCVPIECQCGEMFLFGLSDGTLRKDVDAPDFIPVRCPTCGLVEQLATSGLVSHNGQAGSPFAKHEDGNNAS